MQQPAPETAAGALAQQLSSEQILGEMRVNFIRLCAIALFYSRHLLEFMLAQESSSVRGIYHVRITLVVLLWAALAAAVHILLVRRINPPALKFITSGIDALLITVVCAIGAGPRSPLIMLYFPVIASSALRGSLKLVYMVTTAAILGYLFLLGHYAWYQIGFDRYYATPELRLPRDQQAIVVLCLLVAGMLAGQAVRMVRRLVAVPRSGVNVSSERAT